jgi:hypothetical protein
VFPQQKPSADQPLPDRVQHLLAAVPISEQHLRSKNKHADQDADLAEPSLSQGSTAQTQQSHGLGKIISSIGSFFSGGAIGGYPMQSGGFVTDPQTGMLVDQYTGNLIDPNTGAVVGTRTPAYGGYGSGFGLGNYGGFNSFNNGLSPFGSPYSPYGMGSGLRFGLGGGRVGGMWP